MGEFDFPVGTAETGQVWAASGSWAVVSPGSLFPPAPGTPRTCVVDIGVSDNISISAKLNGNSADRGLSFRHFGVNSTVYASLNGLWKKDGGTLTQIGTYSQNLVANDVVRADIVGDQIQIFKNGSLICTATEPFNNTATQVGFWVAGLSTTTFDDFLVRAI